MSIRQKAKQWIKRYLPAEIISLAATLLCGLLVHHLAHGNMLATALAATWSGNIAYYGYIFITDVITLRRRLHKEGRAYTRKSLLINFRSVIIEFGFAELIDSLFIRPALTYYLPGLLGNISAGILLAKVIADICFYIPAIIGYEMNKKHFG